MSGRMLLRNEGVKAVGLLADCKDTGLRPQLVERTPDVTVLLLQDLRDYFARKVLLRKAVFARDALQQSIKPRRQDAITEARRVGHCHQRAMRRRAVRDKPS